MQRGNILFIILIAVILFAALAAAVTSSMNGGGKNAKNEKDSLDAAVVQQCESLIENSILRLKMMKNCTTEQISYELPGGGNANPDAPANKRCHLFDPAGAGATPCGAYATVVPSGVTIGTITLGDTTTIAMTASGIYGRCTSWDPFFMIPNYLCNLEVSMDGTTFFPASKVCLKKNDGTDNSRNVDYVVSDFFAIPMCQGACGDGSSLSAASDPSPSFAYYMENDLTISPYAGPCNTNRNLHQLNCGCF